MSSRRDRRWGGALLAVVAACRSASAPPATDDASSARAAAAQPAPAAPTAQPAPAAPAARAAPAAPTTQPAPRTVALAEPAIELPRQESFQLLDPGRGSKATLRYAFAPGTVASMVETTLSSRHLERDGFTRPLALPAIRDGFAITVAADRPGQLALHGLAGESATASAETDAYLTPWRTLLQDRRFTASVDERGQLAAIALLDDRGGTRGARARDELVQRLLATIVPLPVEPVGSGAAWRVVTILRQGPAYAKQTATYRLISRGATWKLHVKLQRVGEEQRVADPSLPPGTTADLLALFRLLEGDVEVDPRYPVIAGGSLAIESRMHVRLQAREQPPTEQIFEDTGRAVLSLCRPASPAVPATRPGTPRPLGRCPEGFARARRESR